MLNRLHHTLDLLPYSHRLRWGQVDVLGSQDRIRPIRLPLCLEGMLPFLFLNRGRNSDVFRRDR